MGIVQRFSALMVKAVILLAVLNYGSADAIPLNLLSAAICATAIVASPLPFRNRTIATVWTLAALTLAALIGVAWASSLTPAPFGLENPIWAVVRAFGEAGDMGALSAAPLQTRLTMAALAPALAFLVALRVFQTSDEAIDFLRWLAHFGALFALFALLQHLFNPGGILMSSKQAYQNAVVGTFVYQNAAGAFFGLGTVLSLAFVLHYLELIQPGRVWSHLASSAAPPPRQYRLFARYSAMTFVQAVALALTTSRGAVFATLAASLALFFCLKPSRRSRREPEARRRKAGPALRFTLYGAGGLLSVLFVERVVFRLTHHSDGGRFCVYRATWRAIGDYWPFGSGFATFGDVFPAYRDACMPVDGIWMQAHNVFLEGTLALGAVFPVACFLIYSLFGVIFARAIRSGDGRRYAAAAGASAWLLVTLHSLVDFSVQISGVGVFVAALTAACLAVAADRSREARGGKAAALTYTAATAARP
jgi:hypothetical protein